MLQARLNRDVLEMWMKEEEVCQKASVLKYDPYSDRVGGLLLRGINPDFARLSKR